MVQLEKKVANDGGIQDRSSVLVNFWQTASRLEMYSTSEYRKGRVVFLAKNFPDTGCRIDFFRRRTLDAGLNHGFNR